MLTNSYPNFQRAIDSMRVAFLNNNFGGGERDRTDDLLRARQALSQLSYTPDKLTS